MEPLSTRTGHVLRHALTAPPFAQLMDRAFVRKEQQRLVRSLVAPGVAQAATLARLLVQGADTRFGRDHGVTSDLTLAEFQRRVPVRCYEELAEPYIDAAYYRGEADVLWPGRVTTFAESSGTSGGRKIIPLPPTGTDWVYRQSAQLYMASLLARLDQRRFLRGQTVFFAGGVRHPEHNPSLLVGNITAVSVADMRWYHDIFRAPDRATALLPNWEERLLRMAERTMHRDIVHLAGMPTWIQRFGEIVLEMSGQPSLRAVWPNLQAMTIGGVSPAPYVAGLRQLVGGAESGSTVLLNEVFNATEGFYAAQIDDGDMVLLPDAGIFHEFVPAEDARAGHLDRALGLAEVELGREYAMVISTGVGLWRYLNGDTVRFTARAPYRVRVAGRVSQFLNVTAEKLQVENADRAMADVCAALGVRLVDYTATALKWRGQRDNAVHLWLVEVDGVCDLADFARRLDDAVGRHCADYPRMRATGAQSGAGFGLGMPLVLMLPRGHVARWLREHYGARLSAQSKLPRLHPEHHVAGALLALLSPNERARVVAHLPAEARTQVLALAADQSRMAAM